MNDLGSGVYNLNVGHLLTLWKIDFSNVVNFTPTVEPILYLSAYKDGKSNIVFDGNSYEYIGISGASIRTELNGDLPEPLVDIDRGSLLKSQIYRDLQNEYRQTTGEMYFDWRGAKVTRLRILDNQLADPTKGDYQYYIVNQINKTTANDMEVQLGISLAADRVNNQSVQELAPNRCALNYRLWDGSKFVYRKEKAGGCPYGNPTTQSDWSAVPDFGNKWFDAGDNELESDNKEYDKCSQTLKGCQLRFDPDEYGLALPFVGKYKPVTNDQNVNPDGAKPDA